ncbi:MAG: T9SS type A sorting domain-containing protein [candidate division KSB1 bacterium]|nr:T9SS type A sorting domain-containing protein [candidate division KSB1 bacterium]MDZ7364768.1 T9SS type A sorting domain-containing protein [candidate division KSB1 bacterium]MDZ7402484.1 T9SS type A sorting domain-containing protein [candidate division KSB1 bacterium]
MKRFTRFIQGRSATILLIALSTFIAFQISADTAIVDFETYTLGTVHLQDGWSSSGAAGSGCAVYDHQIVTNTYGYASFGTKSLRMSNAVVSGCFSDQTFSKPVTDEAGESTASDAFSGGFSGGTRQPYFEAEWDFASTVPGAEQPGLSVVASPDRGDGARMSWVQMRDTPTGLEVNFFDYQISAAPPTGTFVFTNVVSGLDRTVPHHIRITMEFVDGPENDIVKVYVDGVLKHTGTSWEDFFRQNQPPGTRTVDCILFRTGGTPGVNDAPATLGKGFLIDNLRVFSGPLPKSFVLLADEDIQINAQFNSDGEIHANNDIFFNHGNKPNSVHTGNVTASDDIFINKRNKIVGTVMGDDVENSGTVTGGITENAGIAAVPLPVLPDIDHGDDDVTVKKGKTLTVAPGDYEEVKVEKKGTLNLKSGTYNLECLNLGEKATLVIDLSSGDPIILNVDEEVIFGKNAVMKLMPSTASTNLITINTDEDDDGDEDFDDEENDDDRLVLGEGAQVFGNLIAPETMVVLGKKSRFKGAICAENILVLNGARFVHHSSTATFPKESEIEEPEVAQSQVITDYVLEQNYPNPFNPSTEISFQLPMASAVKLVIYSITGQVVRELVNGELPAGRHVISWNGRNRTGEAVAGGVYLYRLTIERNGETPIVITKKLTVVK